MKSATKMMFKLFTLIAVIILSNYVFRRLSDHKMSDETPEQKLKAFGYAFNDAGQLRQINQVDKSITDKPYKFDVTNDPAKNQQIYEEIGEVITEYVYKLLVDTGLHRIPIPSSGTKESSFVFGTQTSFEKTKKLLILIHGSGVVRAGQWSRSLIINHSIDHGTQIPYIKRAIQNGFEVLVMNSNHEGHDSAEKHVIAVWKHLIDPVFESIESFAIVAHSYGGVATMALARAYREAFLNKCFAVGFTDSVHSARGLSTEMVEWFQQHARNYVTSSEPLGTELTSRSSVIPQFAAGHTKHEFTSWACIEEMFPFLEAQYKNWLEKSTPVE